MDTYQPPQIDPITGQPIDPVTGLPIAAAPDTYAMPMAAPPVDTYGMAAVPPIVTPPTDTYGMAPPAAPFPSPVDPLLQLPPETVYPDPLFTGAPVSPVPTPIPIGPISPPWYRKPPKPKLADVIEEAEREKDDHEGRVLVAGEMLRRLNLETSGIFERDREGVESGEIEKFWATDLRDEHDAACSHISRMDWMVEAQYRHAIDKEEANAKEDFCHYLIEVEARQHARAGNANIRWALPDILQKYGMLVGFDAIDPLDEECGIRMRLIDPATVFPVHEGDRGLRCVYRVYYATASQVVGDFDGDGSVERKLRKFARNGDGRYDPHFVGEVIEYWDRNWCLVAWEGEQIVLREHGYARVPFTITYGCFGQQGFTTMPDLVATDEYLFGDHARGSARGRGNRRDDLVRIAQPFLWRRTKSHDIEEAVGARLLTALRRSMLPPMVVKQGIASAEEGDPQIDPNEGGITRLRDDDDIQVLPNLPAPEVMTPLFNVLQQNKQTGMASGVLMGQNPAAQTSGFALDILSTAGFEKWSPLVLTIEQFITERMEWRLALVRDWGAILGMDGSRGTLVIPRRNPNPRTGDSPAHEVTPELLKRTGVRVKVRMHKFNPQSLAPIGNGLAIMNSMGAIDKRTIIEVSGITTDPDGMLRRIEDEALEQVPEVLQARTIKRYIKDAEQAMARGDVDTAEELMAEVQFVAEQMAEAQRDKQMTNMALDAQAAEIPQPQGMSMPAMGTPVGQEGGRPPGV